MSGAAATPAGPGWRADVRDRIAAALRAGVPQLRGRVHRARVWPVAGDKASRPAALVYGYMEEKVLRTADLVSQHYDVTCQFLVHVQCAGRPGARFDGAAQEAELEEVLAACERAVLTSPDLVGSGGALEGVPKVATAITMEQRGDDIEAEAKIVFEMRWAEVFPVAEPPTSDCEDATLAFSVPGMS